MRIDRVLALATILGLVVGPASGDDQAASDPLTTIALIDTGINPYHPTFRDPTPLGLADPSTYLPGYPPSVAQRLDLTLDAPTLEDALEADADVWAGVHAGTIYWVPGTRIVGLVSHGPGGTSCDNGVPDIPPVNTARSVGCVERRLLDDHGHGTMTASRAAGIAASLSPTARIVMIEGLGTQGVLWAANQRWIDVQSNSWGSLTPGFAYRFAIELAAQRQLVLFASGNGVAFTGIAPTPTATHPTRAKGSLMVGAHDNGRISAWSDAPAHLVADGFGGVAAPHDSLDEVGPRPIACCTSAAAPYAAGAAAAILREARRLLGDPGSGLEPPGDGPAVVARGTPVPGSPMLEDGVFTLDEWKRVLVVTANPRPLEGPHDGLMQFLGGPATPTHPGHGPGENPFCLLCTTMPVAWSDVSASVPAYVSIGYGSVDDATLEHAVAVLDGSAPLPARDAEDAFFGIEDPVGAFRP